MNFSRTVLFGLIATFILLGNVAFADGVPSPCGCPEGYVYMPPNSSYDDCDAFNIALYCVEDTSIPIDKSLPILVVVSLVGLYYMGITYRKADRYIS